MKNYIKQSVKAGFTLIELLIVIAILGVLAVVVLIAINPAEQLARTRDAGTISTITQLAHAGQAYYTGNSANYPTEANWSTQLVASGELSVFPAAITRPASYDDCNESAVGGEVNDYCYDLDTTYGAIFYSHLESVQQGNKCSGTGTNTAYALFSTYMARGGVVCDIDGQIDPAATFTFVQ